MNHYLIGGEFEKIKKMDLGTSINKFDSLILLGDVKS